MLARGAITWSKLPGPCKNSLRQSIKTSRNITTLTTSHAAGQLKAPISAAKLQRLAIRVTSLAAQRHFIRLNHNGTQFLRPYVDPKLSYTFGKSQEHLIYTTVGHELSKRAEADPESVAFVSHMEDKQITMRQLKADTDRIAKFLLMDMGVKKGDFVGIFSYNCYNWLAIQFACNHIGAVLTPINPSYKSTELAFILKKGHVKCLFIQGPNSPMRELNDHLSVLQSDEIVALSKSGELELRNVVMMDEENEYQFCQPGRGAPDEPLVVPVKLANCRMHNWKSTFNDGLLFRSALEAEEAGHDQSKACIFDPDSVSPDDLFAVYYTSGTTGNPKGACVTHFSALNNVRLVQKRIRAGRPDNYLTISVTCLPMFHIFAGVLKTLSPIVANSQICYTGYKYSMPLFVETMLKYKANFTSVTPTMLIDLLTYVEKKGLQNEVTLKVIQAGGAAIMPEVVARAYKLLPGLEEVRLGYGATENTSVVTLQSIYDPDELRPRTVGPVIDLLEARIVKPNTEQLVPLGEKGEIEVRGFNTMVGYLDEPNKTAETITKNKWYRTGDVAMMHPNGSIEICGRIKHMIIKGGENIYPEEVQKLGLRLDYVEDIHVVGVPDLRFGEQVCAWIKLKPGYKGDNGQDAKASGLIESRDEEEKLKVIKREDVIDYFKQNITYFKVPKYVLFVDEYPLTPTKKVQNHIITERSIEIFKLHDQLGGK